MYFDQNCGFSIDPVEVTQFLVMRFDVSIMDPTNFQVQHGLPYQFLWASHCVKLIKHFMLLQLFYILFSYVMMIDLDQLLNLVPFHSWSDFVAPLLCNLIDTIQLEIVQRGYLPQNVPSKMSDVLSADRIQREEESEGDLTKHLGESEGVS
jgi:hypothetical protein